MQSDEDYESRASHSLIHSVIQTNQAVMVRGWFGDLPGRLQGLSVPVAGGGRSKLEWIYIFLICSP